MKHKLQLSTGTKGVGTREICVIFNLFLHEEYKVSRFLESFRRLNETEMFDFQILLRGPKSYLALEHLNLQFTDKNMNNVHLNFKQEFIDWKLNTYSMVKKTGYRYYLLAQEDHLLVAKTELLSSFIKEVMRLNVDVAPISFFEGYQRLREYLKKRNSNISGTCVSCTLERSWDSEYTSRIWLTSLISLYKREMLIKLLSSPRPIIKRFPPFTPFDFEQKPGSAWFLPLRIALPTSEIFACIDDGPTGSSLQERGLYPVDLKRIPIHNIAGTANEIGSLVKVLDLFFYGISKVFGKANNRYISRCVTSLRFRLKILTRLRYSYIWWRYIVKNKNFSFRDFKLDV